MRVNNVYDVDPAIGSTAVSGFQEWSNFYNKYRVLKIKANWNMVNTTTGIMHSYAYLTPTGTLPSNITAAIDFSESHWASPVKTHLSVTTAAALQNHQVAYDIGNVYGNKQNYIAQDTFVGPGGTNPAGPSATMYLVFIVYSSATWNTTLESDLLLEFEVEFFDRTNIIG
jgi:hypothetical protein